jgi:hypothetical protein
MEQKNSKIYVVNQKGFIGNNKENKKVWKFIEIFFLFYIDNFLYF